MADRTANDPNAYEKGGERRHDRHPPARRTIRPEVLTAIGGLLVGIAAVAGLFIQSIQQDKTVPATTPPTLGQSTDGTTTPSGTAQPTTSDQDSASSSVQYLADLEPISGGMPDTTPQEVGRATYLRSISAETGGCARNQEAAFVYDLGTRFRSFDAVVGLSNQSDSSARVEVRVTADSDRLFTEIVRVGEPRTVKVDVAGKIQLTVHQRYLGPDPNICSDAGDVVWGDARLTR